MTLPDFENDVALKVEPGTTGTDTTPPDVVFSEPFDGADYAPDQLIMASFFCDDGSGSGVASCVGDVEDGEPIDTAGSGTKAFTVTATDNDGNVAVRSVTYFIGQDTDGDALLDAWETNGIDADGDGTSDFDLHEAPYDADPLHQDIYLELDYMDCVEGGCNAGDEHSHEPIPEALQDVVDAFAATPVNRTPTGSTGSSSTSSSTSRLRRSTRSASTASAAWGASTNTSSATRAIRATASSGRRSSGREPAARTSSPASATRSTTHSSGTIGIRSRTPEVRASFSGTTSTSHSAAGARAGSMPPEEGARWRRPR